MKTIGLIGGMSWESTVVYYKALNTFTKEKLGGLHSAKVLINSIDFAELEVLQRTGEWDKSADMLLDCAQSLQKAGADFILIGTNTMHKVAPQVASDISIPLLHIADATAQRLIKDGVTKVGLLGTAYTMEQDFYKGRLKEEFGLEVIVPNGVQRKLAHDVIYNELCLGKINQRSKQDYVEIINDLQEQGAEAVILGCTEITLLVSNEDTRVPLYDTTAIHAEAAVELALAD
ncbi:aspartate/glutamate racemase family protein [Vibrio mexicanus]|uniref:aspartate/glutamate racemase family protein n=1 Tax=Vibrio mexicanus TaxID=1004326 RepID=UPI00063C924D|nr:aspartate/glutamate racemase family protein [Vibrio mexicanus]